MKIVATVDGSGESTSVIPFVGKLARESGARVVLLTVCEPPEGTYAPPERFVRPAVSMYYVITPTVKAGGGRGREASTETIDQATARVYDEAFDFLRMQAEPLEAAGLEVEPQVVIAEDVAKAIVDFAEKEGADLIAMATHGRSGIREVVQGSVAAAVVRAGSVPVLLVRPAAKKD
jgi:nucleotide-binding universal stress UspA family protein